MAGSASDRHGAAAARGDICGICLCGKYSLDQWVACVQRIETRSGFNPYKIEADVKKLKSQHEVDFSYAEREKARGQST
ncbi:hypothetical protein D3C71_2071700 [compost metagenome]